MEIIQLGHYQSRQSLTSDSPEIIRVLGPDTARENYWKTQDGKSIPSYELENNYVLLNTTPGKELPTKPPINIFAGIGDDEAEIQDNEYFEPEQIPIIQPVKLIPINEQQLITIQEQQAQQKPQIPFDISIIDKINIDRLNKKSMTNLGIVKFQKPTINLELPIVFDYDISKLKQTIDLLELDENIILDYLVKTINIGEIHKLLKQSLKQQLDDINKPKVTPLIVQNHSFQTIPEVQSFEKTMDINDPKFKVKNDPILLEKLVQESIEKIPETLKKIQEEDIVLTSGISEVEKYLLTFATTK